MYLVTKIRNAYLARAEFGCMNIKKKLHSSSEIFRADPLLPSYTYA